MVAYDHTTLNTPVLVRSLKLSSLFAGIELCLVFIMGGKWLGGCLRPYHTEYTSSRQITEVKQCWACPVLGWVTAWEQQVL